MGSGMQVKWLALDKLRDNTHFVLGRKEKHEGSGVTRFGTCGNSLLNDSMTH